MNRRTVATVAALLIGVAAVAGVITARGGELQAFSEERPHLGQLGRLIPSYPGMQLFPMGDSLHVNGVARQLAYGTTPDAVFKVADRYEAIWNSQGYDVKRFSSELEEWVTAMAPEDPWLRSVIVRRVERETTLIATVSGRHSEAALPQLPVPGGCEVVSHTGAVDGRVSTEMAFLQCDAYLREITDFYDGALHGTKRLERFPGAVARGDTYVTYSGERVEVILAATQTESDPPRTSATVTWQERR